MKNYKKNGFTLVEIIITISILAVLISISIFIFRDVTVNGRNTRRVNDIKQLQLALEIYRKNEGSYPGAIIPGEELKSPSDNTIFLKSIPKNPAPRNDGACLDQEYQYVYNSLNDTYTLSFCISSNVESLSPGNYQANISGITKI